MEVWVSVEISQGKEVMGQISILSKNILKIALGFFFLPSHKDSKIITGHP